MAQMARRIEHVMLKTSAQHELTAVGQFLYYKINFINDSFLLN